LKDKQIFFGSGKRSVCFNLKCASGYCQIFYIFAPMCCLQPISWQHCTNQHIDYTDPT